MEEKTVLTKGQACSAFVTKMLENGNGFSEQNLYIKNEMLFNEYVRLKQSFPNDDVENTIIRMIKTNNTFLSRLNRNKELAKEINEYFFKENGTPKDFIDSFSNFNLFTLLNGSEKAYKEVEKFSKKNEFDKIINAEEIYKTGALDFDFVKTQFPKNTDAWKIKEAVAWLVCYVENMPYDLNEVLVKSSNGNYANKYKTFEKLIEKTNEASITENNPFTKGKNTYFFNEAKSSEVDVMMWNPKKRKVIASSATRDRGFKIEGNQFIRHMLDTSLLSNKINYFVTKQQKEYKDDKKAFEHFKSNKYVQSMVRQEGFKKVNFNEYLINNENRKVKSFIKNKIHNGDNFARAISAHRGFVSDHINKLNKKNEIESNVNFNENGLTISENEAFLHTIGLERHVDYVYYGETVKGKHEPLIFAGFNTLSYKDNFKKIGDFEFDDKAIELFLDVLNKRFNGIPQSEKNVEKYAHEVIYNLFNKSNDSSNNLKLIQLYSNTNASSEERGCLYKSFSVMFKYISNEIENGLLNDDEEQNERNLDKRIKIGITSFFKSNLNKSEINSFVKKIKDDKNIEEVFDTLNEIRINNSEVPQELEELKTSIRLFKHIRNEYEAKNNSLLLKQANSFLMDEQDKLKQEILELKKKLESKSKLENKEELDNSDKKTLKERKQKNSRNKP